MTTTTTHKPNCYKCKFRGTVPGDSHSCCRYPGTDVSMFGIINSNNLQIMRDLNVQADEHGISMGWFLWPVNFDPIWIENCNGFNNSVND